MFMDAGLSFDQIMLYESEREHIEAMKLHWPPYLARGNGMYLLGEMVDFNWVQNTIDPPGPQEIADQMRVAPPQVQRALRILTEQKQLVRVDQDLLFHAEAIAAAKERLVSHIQQNGGLESVKFKYLLDTSRKYAIPLLDYFDKIGVTRRVGYTRLLK